MQYNEIINRLKLWLRNTAEIYEKIYQKHGDVTYIGYILANEWIFKLSMLIDKNFESKDDLRNTILNLHHVHYEESVRNPKNETANYIIEKINAEFFEYLEEILSQKDHLPPADIPYYRVIIGEEAEDLLEKFRKIWGYDGTDYWFPLTSKKTKEISEKFFIMFDYVEPYIKQIEKIIGLPQAHIYECDEEEWSYPKHCFENAELIEYSAAECFYTDKDFSWAIYFSHEATVSFAGRIVPKIKELLKDEEAHWNRWEYDFD